MSGGFWGWARKLQMKCSCMESEIDHNDAPIISETQEPSNEGKTFTVIIRFLTGKTLKVEVKQGDGVNHLRSKIQDLDGTPIAQQRLIFAGKPIGEENPNELLSECGITGPATIHLLLKLAS
ncbi:unnamed protein product [Blepharisma stoltei]|uniref:Ubiquitin-like domain-containing protein n=1 Tax=Blepharisma stoltei TaxID=1481888 RepID=A0AAU9J8W8_9CILI|nr:unnamed protein product [Blepharisma stoltei]